MRLKGFLLCKLCLDIFIFTTTFLRASCRDFVTWKTTMKTNYLVQWRCTRINNLSSSETNIVKMFPATVNWVWLCLYTQYFLFHFRYYGPCFMNTALWLTYLYEGISFSIYWKNASIKCIFLNSGLWINKSCQITKLSSLYPQRSWLVIKSLSFFILFIASSYAAISLNPDRLQTIHLLMI